MESSQRVTILKICDFSPGLEVIHEETESQMSSSDSELDFDSDTNSGGKTGGSRRPAFPFLPTSSPPSRAKEGARGLNFFDAPPLPETTTMRHDASPEEIFQAEEGLSLEEGEEGIAKHIRISPNWDPVIPCMIYFINRQKNCEESKIVNVSDLFFSLSQEPILTRLYTMQESKPLLNNKNAKKDCLSGFLNILSGNRKKGTFWNAWKRKFYVLSAGKLNGYEVFVTIQNILMRWVRKKLMYFFPSPEGKLSRSFPNDQFGGRKGGLLGPRRFRGDGSGTKLHVASWNTWLFNGSILFFRTKP